MYKKIIISILLCVALLAQPFSYAHAETDQEVTGKSIEKTNDVEQNTDTTTGKMDDETASETKVQHTTDDIIAVYDSLDKTAGGILTNDSAYISSSVIIKKQTGTPYWDEEEGQGNDIGPDDNIVRSFDTVTYTIENTIKVNDTDHGSADAKKYYNFKGGKIYFEAYFPNEYQKVMHWNTESMKWASDLKTEGGKLTGYYQMPEGEITIPGKQTLVFPLKIDGAADGTEATPYFKIWLQGNAADEMIQLNDTDGFTVTAKPSYNVKLQNWDSTTKWITWNDQDGQGDKSGRAYGYSLLLQLYNDNTKKGLKGIEYPQGDISFDLDFTLTRINRKTSKTEDITSASGMELYNYKENDYQRRAGKIPNRSMVWSVHSDRNYTIPGSDLVKLGQTKNDYYISRYVYNGGSISMKQTDQTLHVELSDYDFNGTFPWTTLGSESNDTTIRFGSNIGCFATGFLQLTIPKNEATTQPDCDYQIKMQVKNFHAEGLDGEEVTEDALKSDNTSTRQHVTYSDGSFGVYNWSFDAKTGKWLCSHYSQGDAKAFPGDIIRLYSNFSSNGSNDSSVEEINQLVKFDSKIMQPTTYNGKAYVYNTRHENSDGQTNDLEIKLLYAAKPDGTDWKSDDELLKATDNDLLYFTSMDKLKEKLGENARCVAMLWESTGGAIKPATGLTVCPYMQIEKNAEIGYVAMHTTNIRAYYKHLDRETYTYEKQDNEPGTIEMPKADINIHYNYVKSAYDEDGNIIAGTHKGNYVYGNSILIVGATSSISKTTENNKTNYDLSKGENEVTWKVNANGVTKNDVKLDNRKTTMTITETLPKELTYVKDSSNYGNPEITEEDGKWILKWTITDYELDSDPVLLTYRTSIDEGLKNGTQLDTSSMVALADYDLSTPKFRVASKSIQIANLASHRLYKKAEKTAVEKNAELAFDISYVNNNEYSIDDFALLDILPYNNDGRGTNYHGDYMVKNIEVEMEDIESKENTDTSSLQLYSTSSTDIYGTDAKNVDLSNFTQCSFGELKKQMLAYYIKGSVPKKTKLNVRLVLVPKGNTANDVYANDTSCQTSLNTEKIQTPAVKIGVMYREINGCVWNDLNKDGYRADSEKLLTGYQIKLTDDTGNPVKDIDGNIVQPCSLDSTGRYIFKNLKQGDYQVSLIRKNGWDQSKVTTGNKNNDAENENGTSVIKNIHLWTEEEMNAKQVYSYIASDYDIGIYKRPEITIIKKLNLKDVIWEKGNPTFLFKITGTDVNGVRQEFCREVTFHKNDAEQKEISFWVPAGTYTVSEIPVWGYRTKAVTAGDHCTVKDDNAILDTISAESANCTYENEVSNYGKFTDKNVIVNELKK